MSAQVIIADQSGLLDGPYLDLFRAQAETALAKIASHMTDWNPTWTINFTVATGGPGMIASTTNDGYEPIGATAHGLPVYAPGTDDFTTTIFLGTFLTAGYSLSMGAPETSKRDTVGMLEHEIARGLGVASALTMDGGTIVPWVSTYDAHVSVLPGLGAYFHASDGEVFALIASAAPGTMISTTLTSGEILSYGGDFGQLIMSHEDEQILADTNPHFHLIGLNDLALG